MSSLSIKKTKKIFKMFKVEGNIAKYAGQSSDTFCMYSGYPPIAPFPLCLTLFETL